jgi:glycosyltransferase involved in cell wall biosynthesis
MRLLLLDQFSDPGGAQQGLVELLPAMRDRGWEGLLGIPGEGELFERARELGFQAECLKCGPYASGRKSLRDAAHFLREAPVLARHIARMARRARAQLVYVNGPRLLPATALANIDAPVLFHAHSYIGPGLTRKLAGMSLRRKNTCVLGNCEFVAAPWRDFVPSGRVRVIYNGVGPAPPLPRTGSRPTVACIGRIAPEKGQLEFLEAARRIHRAFPECRLRIIGAALFAEPGAERYDRAVRSAAADLPVEFAGWLTDIYAALAGIDLLLVPSAPHEATTRVILEAYAAGVPVIAFRSGGIPEVVDDGQSGCLANSAAEMAELAICLLGDTARRENMGRTARRSWQLRFTLERYRADVIQAIEHTAAV